MAFLEVKNIKKSFGKTEVLKGVSFNLEKGEVISVIGSSGNGKTTLLRMVAGLETQTNGDIFIGNELVNDVHPKDRNIAMVFQSYALYPHMSVYKNMAFGLKNRKVPKEEIDKKVISAAKMLEIEEYLNRKPRALSGGQRQRVLIARAIAGNPDILILDDSSSALDYKTDLNLRSTLQTELPESTVITVAQRVSSVKNCDLILVIDEGRIIGRGTHDDLLENCPEYKEISDSQMGGAFVD